MPIEFGKGKQKERLPISMTVSPSFKERVQRQAKQLSLTESAFCKVAIGEKLAALEAV